MHLSFALCLLATGLQAKDYEIKLRLLNGRTGEPFPNERIWLWLSYSPPGPRGKTSELLNATTSLEGAATFALSDPLPEHLGLAFGRDDLWSCDGPGPILPEEILKHGLVEENKCDKKGRLKGKVVAKPGELVIFAKPRSWWRGLIPLK